MRTPFATALLIGAVLLNPVANAASIAGNVSCSGELSSLSATFGHLSCAGNLSLSDAAVTDPVKLVLEASGSLTLLRSTLEAPELVLVAPHIDIDSDSTLRTGGALGIITATPQPLSPAHPSSLSENVPLPTLPVNGAGGATLTQSGGGGGLPGPRPFPQGGSVQLGQDGDASVAIVQSSSGAGAPPLSIASTVPEPSAALLLTAGLGLFALRRNMNADRR